MIENLAVDGSALVRASFAPPEGATVVDKARRPLGRVRRVFGPVARPYVAVSPHRTLTMAAVGSEVFVD